MFIPGQEYRRKDLRALHAGQQGDGISTPWKHRHLPCMIRRMNLPDINLLRKGLVQAFSNEHFERKGRYPTNYEVDR